MTIELFVIGCFAFTAFGLLILNRPRREPYWPGVTKAYITAIFAEDEATKQKAWEEFDKHMLTRL